MATKGLYAYDPWSNGYRAALYTLTIELSFSLKIPRARLTPGMNASGGDYRTVECLGKHWE
jgi:hypothetical protein